MPLRCASCRPIARSSPVLTFCALSCILSAGTSSYGSVFGMQLFAIQSRSRSSFAKAMAAQWRRVAACAAGLPSGQRCWPCAWWPYRPSLVPSQGSHSRPPLSQRLYPGACGAGVARSERQCRLCGWVARLWSVRAARPRRSRASYVRRVRARVVPNHVSSDQWCANRLNCALISHNICIAECGKRREAKI